MLRSIRQIFSGASRTNLRRKPRSRPASRRLGFEGLEGRKMLTTTAPVSALFNAISDSSFETPTLLTKTFQYAPNGSPWQFSGGAGISNNGSPVTSSNTGAPDGAQVAFIQCNGSLSQAVYLSAGSYTLAFVAAQRAGVAQTHLQELQVLVDGVQVGTVTPVNDIYGTYQLPAFNVATSGVHTLEFLGLNPQGGDNTALLDEVTLSESNAISDSSFEQLALPGGSFQTAPSGSPWQFLGSAGISSNGSGFTGSNPGAPDGSQVAFLQATGSMSQSVNLSAGTYSLSFLAAQRAGAAQAHNQQIQVLVDSAPVGQATPNSTSYGSYQTPTFTVTSGVHTVKFAGLNQLGGDNTALIDEVVVAPVVNSLVDGNFNVPALATTGYQYVPDGVPWQFHGAAGITNNGSAFTAANPAAPQGTQVAFLQSYGNMGQTTYLDAGTYCLSFQAAQRANGPQSHPQEIQILVDNAPAGLVTPASTSYGLYQSSNFTVGAGPHTIRLVGLDPQGGDNTAFVEEVVVSPAADSISDGSFEAPGLPANGLLYAANGSPWQCSGMAGVARNGSAFGAAAAPDGIQVGFLQGYGYMSQSVYLDAGAYSISFQAAQRGGSYQAHSQEIQVLVDSVAKGLITPTGTSFGLYQTPTFSVGAGTHTIEFAGLNQLGGDNTAFIDQVAISPQADVIAGGSFEAPGLAGNTFQYAPNGLAWQFTGPAGVSGNGSGFTSANPNAPDGAQVAFLQDTGSMAQSVYLYSGTYTIAFQAAQRASSVQAHYQQIQVLVDGAQVGLITPYSTSYGLYQTSNFKVSVGMHTVTFAGLDPLGGDNTAFVDEVVVSPQADSVRDGGFEAPGLAAATYQYVPNGSPWTFTGGAGVTNNGSGFTAANPNAPDGTQVAFLQATAAMSQSVYLDAGTYGLSFQAAQRAGNSSGSVQTHYQQIQVLVDGAQVGLITPVGTSYSTYQTSNFTVAAGMHTVKFAGLNPQGGDNTAFVDAVTLLPPADSIVSGSFERPGLAPNSFQYAPSGSPWQFTGQAGISSNGSAITSANPNAPDGTQVAFIQGNGSMSQSVSLDAGTYSVSFQAAQRGGILQTHYQELQFLVDGAQVGLVTPSGTSYALYQTPTFTVAAGTHTIQLVGLNPQGGNNTALVDQVALTLADAITGGSFEAPALAANTYQYAPAGSPWQFTGQAGVSSNGSTLTSGNPDAPDGTQVAFIENSGSLSQSVLLDAGSYSITFLAAQRAGAAQTHYQQIQVLLDGAQVGLITPSGTSYSSYQTSTFTVTSGVHVIKFVGLNPQGGENIAFLDEVQI
jgi:hypothetical protein